MKVLQVSTGYTDGRIEKELIEAAGGEYRMIGEETDEAILAGGRDTDVLLIALTKVSKHVISQMENLKLIVRAGIGVDNIDLDAAKEKGVHVCNLPHYCQDEVADDAVAMILALERQLFPQVRDMRAGMWNPVKTYKPIRGLADTTVGFIGCGGIARKAMARLKPFGVRCIGYDPYLPAAVAESLGLELVSLDDLLHRSDYVSLHVPLTAETRGVLNADSMKKMKKTACIINTARGPLVDNDALYAALEAGEIRGAGLDVIDGDLEGAKRFAAFENVLITPHTAYYSARSDYNIRAQAGELIAKFIGTGVADNQII